MASSAVETTVPLGRVGSLTAEEEAKLRDFWRITLRVFGALSGEEAESLRAASVLDSSTLDTASTLNGSIADDDGKRSKRGMMGWRRSRQSTPKKESRKGGADATETDKYGQTKDFQQALATNTPEQIRSAFWAMVKADHPDALLLRFLRARKWDIDKAQVMMISTLHWRLNVMRVDDDLMLNGELGALKDSQSSDPAKAKEAKDFLAQMRMGKAFLHGTDRVGRPICHICVRIHKIGAQSDTSLERLTVYTFEMARLMLNPPVDTACLIFDMTGFSLSNMDYTPLKFIIRCFEANYPESLGVVLVHKAPWLFQGFWKIIRGWLDPVVASKIHFTANLAEMENFIERDHIPKSLEGDEDWEYDYQEPIDGENYLMKDTTTRDKLQEERAKMSDEYENVVREWLRSPSAISASLTAERDRIASQLKENYWQLDPYIRARSMYDRNELVGDGGEITFYEVWEDALEYPIDDKTVHINSIASNGVPHSAPIAA